MKAKQQMLCCCLIAAAVSAGWIHGGLRTVLEYASWEKVAADAPCNTFEKDGRDVKVIGPVIVNDKPYEQHILRDDKLVDVIEKRCPK
jgi:hypothetical protein